MLKAIIDVVLRFAIARVLSAKGYDPSLAGPVLEKGRAALDKLGELADLFVKSGEKPEQAVEKAADISFGLRRATPQEEKALMDRYTDYVQG